METVLVTGASRGIGLQLTRRFAETDRHVVATARNPGRSPELSALASSRVTVATLDVTDPESVSRLQSDLSSRTVDVLINNAGILGGDRQSVAGMDYAAWVRAFEVNTLAPFRVTTAFLPGDHTDVDCYGEGVGIAVRKGDDELRDAFSAAIAAIRDNGTYQKINDTYFPFDIYGGRPAGM